MINSSVIIHRRVLVFKTNIENLKQAESMRPALNSLMKENDKWNFDLEDCDNILRAESLSIAIEAIQSVFSLKGYQCEELPD